MAPLSRVQRVSEAVCYGVSLQHRRKRLKEYFEGLSTECGSL